ncbi:MAG: trypsin-like peptidase domain-containing protein [Alphaproteobacteria bacterium]|nr:trypsin-like peptidase domain-containing protein [Alphaproteobacteria bacterium]MCB9697667.1 trypsin-like peptidase domain-containing protein [Alphaproteobacteria bacterium]
MTLGIVLGVLSVGAWEASSAPPRSPPPTVAAVAPTQPPPVQAPSSSARTEDERNSIDVFRAMAPATVFVTQNQLVLDRYSLRATEVPTGTGSGFVWDAEGHVVTNYHVIDGARSLSVTLQDQSVWPATLVGGDPMKDVAVLHIDAPASQLVPVVPPPPGYELEVGQKTLAIGNPFGLDHTLTTGVISALGREIVGYGNVTIKGMIQTDASINPGNSGGPLLDSSGRLIGMNSMIYSQAGQSAGIGFAVPYTIVQRVVDQIVTNGEVTRIGIGVDLVDDRIARRAGIDGVAILNVRPGTPAEKAGITGLRAGGRGAVVGDVIVRVGEIDIHDFDDFYNALDPHRPGEQVRVVLVRDGKEWSTQLDLIAVGVD